MKPRWIALLCFIPFLIFFIAFELAPLGWIAVHSFYSETDEMWGFGNYREILTSPFYLQAMRFSMDISVWSSIYGLIIALIGSYSLRKIAGSKLHDLMMSFTNMTSNFAGVPLAFAFIILFGLNGCFTLILKKIGWIDGFNLYTKDGLILLYTYFQIPLGVLLLYPAFDALRDDWKESASLLGANLWQFWRHIGLPVMTPALIGTFVILLANSLGAYATIYALTSGNYNVVPIRIASLVSGDISLDPNMGSALAMLLVVLMVVITCVHQWILKRSYLKTN